MNKISRFIVFVIVISQFVISCQNRQSFIHKGVKQFTSYHHKLDSVLISADSISWDGNFFATKDYIGFADKYYCRIFKFDKNSGSLIGSMLTKGHAKTEIPSFMYAYPFANDEKRICIIDASLFMYIYNTESDTIEYRGRIDFAKDEIQKDDFSSPSVYVVMSMTDCGMDAYINDNHEVILPLSIVDRHLSRVDENRYKEGRIWGRYSLDGNKFVELFGRYPHYYLDNMASNFENFRSVPCGDEYMVCHTVDSLIYVYDNDMKSVLYTFGYEFQNADRSYSYQADNEYMSDDIKRVSLNSSLVCTNKYIMRSCFHKIMDDAQSYTSLQFYDRKTYDLVAEERIQGIIQFFSGDNNKFYGVNIKPNSNDKYYIYTFEIYN